MIRLLSKEMRALISEDRMPIELTETYSIRPYAARVPNRNALGSGFLTEKAECHYVSLPLLKIQERAA